MDFNWKRDLTEWVKTKRKIKHLSKELITFFELAFDNLAEIGFNNVNVREKAWFGVHSNRASLVIGRNFFASCHLGKYKGLYLITDESFSKMDYLEVFPVKETENLYWLLVSNFEDINKINAQSIIWESYSRASQKIFRFKKVSADKDSFQLKYGKNKVSDFWNNKNNTLISVEDVEKTFEIEVRKSLLLSNYDRLQKLVTASQKPISYFAQQKIFNRNAVVVAVVLERANGFCENCGNSAPFRRKDGTPYLEVHHKIRLADNGDDTVENAIALCPNCHREAHYGDLKL